ncbi:MAG: hypothetical protein R3277_06775 [Brumimicrobium sp.]|nr:hypothetical protein [Brumimicrobium sp.]
MKVLLFSLVFLAANLIGYSQECLNLELLEKGSKWEITSYDKKDKVSGYTSYEVLDVTTGDNAIVWKVKMILKDDKGEPVSEQTTEIKCEDGTFKVDMKQFMNPAQLESMKDMEVKIDATDIQFPLNPEVGQTLPDAKITIEAIMSGMSVMNIETTVTDRKIEKEEEVTTPIGTNTALVISQTSNVKNKFLNMTTTSKDWYVPGFGVVKTESYDKKGKYAGKTVLTSYTKG